MISASIALLLINLSKHLVAAARLVGIALRLAAAASITIASAISELAELLLPPSLANDAAAQDQDEQTTERRSYNC